MRMCWLTVSPHSMTVPGLDFKWILSVCLINMHSGLTGNSKLSVRVSMCMHGCLIFSPFGAEMNRRPD